MATNLSALQGTTTTATGLANLVLVSFQDLTAVGYQPQNPVSPDNPVETTRAQPSKLLFHYEGEQSVTLESDITDHYVESNRAIQDQIAVRPVIINTHGFIGELNDIAPPGLQQAKTAAQKLQPIGSYTPAKSVTAQIAFNQAFFNYQIAANAFDAITSAWSSLTGGPQNKQQIIFQQFYGYWQRRILFKVQTPWAVFQNMAIKSLRAVQDAETRMITDFEVSFKQINVAASAFGNDVANSLSERASVQNSTVVDTGTSSGTPSDSVSEGISKTNGGAVA